ncbi:hypothetical protein HJG45_25325 [Roseicella sp. DB1501]|nr:hypothetical protein [Roseicella sp. DB1501]
MAEATLPAAGLLPWAPELTGEAAAITAPSEGPPEAPSPTGGLCRLLRAARAPLFSVLLGGVLAGVVLDHASALYAGLRSAFALAMP